MQALPKPQQHLFFALPRCNTDKTPCKLSVLVSLVTCEQAPLFQSQHPETMGSHCRELDSGSSTPSSMPPSAAGSPRRWSSFGNRGRLSEEGGAMLRRASEAAGMAEAGLHLQSHLPQDRSGASSPDNGTTCHSVCINSQAKTPAGLACTWSLVLAYGV